MAIRNAIDGYLANLSKVSAKSRRKIFHNEVGVLLLHVLWVLPVLKLRHSTSGKVLTGHAIFG
eukprot:CAMPEP_0197706056 /NCGR_PEP_ID=MMETSP1338-20131121/126753_1 /TAXON_ID=43686 ORGANISM="Pelagodinium beii, Strain RCC1491" /NCGR_SAMPLE_ID=MMETSP1338 /ASSEMBLY_ACC=CAM_ASM_000754 /LENGTH=62 /DNA_ID=CAMNT_0043289965 /DNA_START=1619 /DNA_END=1803 /DNA_ORIENTATION=+